MSQEFGDYGLAQRTVDVIRQITQQEIDAARPKARFGIVDSINEDSSAMVRFIGENEAVRIPFLSTAPAKEGQEVKIEGPPSDRVITDVRGATATDAQLAAIMEEMERRKPIFGEWTRGATAEITLDLATISWTANKYEPIGGIALADGGSSIVIPEDGYYKIRAQFNLRQSEGTKTVYLQCVPASGATSYDFGLAEWHASANDTTWYAEPLVFPVSTSDYFYAGDKIKVHIACASDYNLYGDNDGRSRTNIYVERKYGGPKLVP